MIEEAGFSHKEHTYRWAGSAAHLFQPEGHLQAIIAGLEYGDR